MEHVPVLAREAVHWMGGLDKPAVVIDATVGAGGHSSLFLEHLPVSSLLAVDADFDMLERARQRLASGAPTVSFHNMWFDEFFAQYDGFADRIFFDLGVSMYHLGLPEGGFSIKSDGALDMRLDRHRGNKTAADLVNTRSEREIADAIFAFGEERLSRRISRAIVNRRTKRPFETTGDLAGVVASVVTRGRDRSGRVRRHPATRTFQALRIWVNDELERIRRALPLAAQRLAVGGRLGVISFHSLEDRIVKQTFRALSTHDPSLPMVDVREAAHFRLLTKKPITPLDDEVRENRASRSAKLRVVERIGGEE